MSLVLTDNNGDYLAIISFSSSSSSTIIIGVIIVNPPGSRPWLHSQLSPSPLSSAITTLLLPSS